MRVDYSVPGASGQWVTTYFPGIEFVVKSYSWAAVGGPEKASISAAGASDDLLDLSDMVGSHVRIYDDNGTLVWWGIVGQVEIPFYKLTITIDIEKMYNRIAVAYTTVAAGESTTGVPAQTSWVEDTDSIQAYGKRELLDSLGGTTAVHAERMRDKKLNLVKYPQAKPQARIDGNAGDTATITCIGYWQTLEWMYCSVETKLAFAYETLGTLEQTIGKDDANDYKALAQVFQTGPAAWNLLEVELYVKKVGTPPNDLSVAICANTDNLTPGTSLGSATVAAANISTSYAWVRFTLSSPIALSTNGHYFLQVSTSGVNSTGYYVTLLDSNMGYTDGVLRIQGSGWGGINADMPFRIYTDDIIENSQQIRNILTLYGQYFSRVHVDDVSGISTESYRNGKSDSLTEVISLLDTGTAAADRMLATVGPDRSIRIYAMSDKSVYLTVDRNGHFYEGMAQIEDSTCPVAQWVKLGNAVTTSTNTTRISGLDMFFLERSEYNAEQKSLTWDSFGMDDLFDMEKGE